MTPGTRSALSLIQSGEVLQLPVAATEGAAIKTQADEGRDAGLGGNSTAGSLMHRPQQSWEWMLEPVEQAGPVASTSQTSSGRH